jgi:arylsulfatase A-like enzyme
MKIAEQGTYYNHVNSPDSYTMGSMPHLLGLYDQMNLLDVLRQHGYTTFITNTNLLVHIHFDQYFDDVFHFPDKREISEVPAWKNIYNRLRSHAKLSPFFEWIPYHVKLMWRLVSHELPYTTAQVALNHAYYQTNDRIPYFQWIHLMDSHNPYYPVRHGYSKWILGKYYGIIYDILQGKIDPDPDVVGVMRRLYLENIQEMDEEIGKFYDKLDLNDTILIILADHGEAFGEAGCYGHPQNMQEPALTRVPLIVVGDGLVEDINMNLSFFPQMICQILGLPPAEKIEKTWMPETVESLEQKHENLRERLAKLGYM